MVAKSCIEYEIPLLYNYHTIGDAIDWCEQFNSKYVYIADENKLLLGYAPTNLLYELNDENLLSNIELQEFNYDCFEYLHLFEFFKIASNIDTYILPIIDKQNILQGFSSPEKILQTYLQQNQILSEGGVLVLSIDPKDYSLSEISRIIENDGANILNVSIVHNAQTNTIEAILKINKTDLKAIEASFERYNYTILQLIHQSEIEIDLQNRIDNLMKYLQV